jgi:hypothetical protein
LPESELMFTLCTCSRIREHSGIHEHSQGWKIVIIMPSGQIGRITINRLIRRRSILKAGLTTADSRQIMVYQNSRDTAHCLENT